MRQSKPKNKLLPECVAKLRSILEIYGEDTFCNAVQNLLDNHPSTKHERGLQLPGYYVTKQLCYRSSFERSGLNR